MSNPSYIKGRKKEYKVCAELREKGFDIVQRSAGSHSPIDIFAINRLTKVIKFIQVKPDSYKGEKLMGKYNWMNGMFRVEFEVV